MRAKTTQDNINNISLIARILSLSSRRPVSIVNRAFVCHRLGPRFEDYLAERDNFIMYPL